jgi:hypothetical protein
MWMERDGNICIIRDYDAGEGENGLGFGDFK